MIKEKNLNFFFIISALFLISRAIIYYLGIYPDHIILSSMWQVLDLKLLEHNFISSIYYLHYQPPLWNIIVGLIVKIFGPDYLIISKVIYFFNLIISLISIFILFKLILILKINQLQTYAVYFFYILFSLSYIFYENYLHYTHLTTLFFLLFIYNYFQFVKAFSLKYEFNIYIVATFLVYTWSAFSHPLFIFLIFFTIILMKFNYKLLRSTLVFLLFLIISILPSIKNKVELNFFGNSSWVGLQIIQVLKRWDVLNGTCDMNFNNIHKYEKLYLENNKIDKEHPALTGEFSRWNNVGMIFKTKKCLKKGLDLIIKDPYNYFSIVKYNFISTHGHFAFDHGHKPVGWEDHFNLLDKLKENKVLNQIKVRSIQLYYIIIYLFFLMLLVKSLFFIHKLNVLNNSKVMSSIFLIYAWMIILTHMFAGFEQERMRHIGHFMHILFFCILLKNRFNLIKMFKANY